MSEPRPVALVVDRDHEDTRALVAFLRANQFDVEWTRDSEGAANVLEREHVDCLVSEARAPRIDGLALLSRARERNPAVCAVMITEGAELSVAVEAMRRGAYDFQSKPVNLHKLLATLRLGREHQRLAERVVEMEQRLDRRFGLRALSGRSRAIQRVRDQVRQVAAARAPVLIEGEPGSGRGVVARALHQNGPRRDRRFERVRCDAVSEPALEAELFGVEAPAATPGAPSPRPGRLELADGGTLFLEDIEHAAPAVQLRLLRFLQDRAFERAGGSQTRRADVRLIATTGRDLAHEAREGRFREDLLYRLAVVRIVVPPLRERHEDIPELVEAFVREANRELARRVPGVTPGLLERLRAHDWPGNVSELKGVIDGMVATARGRARLDVSALPEALRGARDAVDRIVLPVGATLAEAERQLIEATLRRTAGDRRRAAAMLGIGLRTLYRRLREIGPS